MDVGIKELTEKELAEAVKIWNSVVEDGVAFPQMEPLTLEAGRDFFAVQSYTGIAYYRKDHRGHDEYEVVGLYILHPNNVGRCGHICNASYAVRKDCRGRHIGEALVKDCIKKARELDFRILQFNAVVRSNQTALALYRKLGFTQLGVIPNGFLLKDGNYEDIILCYLELTNSDQNSTCVK